VTGHGLPMRGGALAEGLRRLVAHFEEEMPRKGRYVRQPAVFGDEQYARYENVDGYTVVYDEAKGLYCYATLAVNRLVSTGVPVDQPPPAGLARHLQESQAVRLAKIEERTLRHHPHELVQFQ
ncbi:MAG TPA: hypothetical protein VEY95_14045, partial [Azospirillaceae bacterium]|nr:hypothetical protein [Azospirillaceae bacterium]